MNIHQDDLWLCEDCVMVGVNGDESGIDDNERIQEIEAGLGLLGHLSPDFDGETGEGIEEYSTSGCDCCGESLAGSRHRFVVLCDHPECAV